MAIHALEIETSNVTLDVNESKLTLNVSEASASIEFANAGIQGPKGDIDTSSINAHINSETPHPTYDDLPALSLLFENGLI